MVGTTVTECTVAGCNFKTFSSQPSMALSKHYQQTHVSMPLADPRVQQNRGLYENLRVATLERDALRDHLEKFHICSDLCRGERP